jgi:hypothetical protein
MFRNLLFASVALMLSGPGYAEEGIDDASVPGSASLSAANNVKKLAGCFAVTYEFAEVGTTISSTSTAWTSPSRSG